MKDLQGKVGFITGGASGIGLGIAKVFVRNGMKVVIADLRQDHLDCALAYFDSQLQRASVHGIRLDVTDRTAMAAAADEAERRFGKVHIVVNNAGVGLEGPLDKATYDDWDFGIGVNLVGVVNGVQTFLPRIRRHGEGGHIVNTASLAGMTAATMPAWMVIYTTTKAAVIAMSESLHTELPSTGVGVTVLCPGPIKSNIHEAWKNRPDHFKQNSGYTESEARLGRRIVPDIWMEPERVGERWSSKLLRTTIFTSLHTASGAMPLLPAIRLSLRLHQPRTTRSSSRRCGLHNYGPLQNDRCRA
jgi:NAD(P)-dependent dehydrogenase (short-subunit alcohol dehydrogenase family)